MFPPHYENLFFPKNSDEQQTHENRAAKHAAAKKIGGGKKFLVFVCVLALAAIGFAAAEKFGLTGTHFVFGESGSDSETGTSESPRRGDAEKTGKPSKRPAKKTSPRDAAKNRGDAARAESDAPDSGKKSSAARKKSAAKKKAAKPVPPLPVAIFADISRFPHTWPSFVRLTRSRTISLIDPSTGYYMGRMDVPAGTVVKILKVNANGTLDVFDRTGQKFQVEASGTNFAAAFAAARNRPKRPPKKKEKPAEVAKAEAPEKAETPAPAQPKKQAQPNRNMSAFGTVIDDSEWDAAEEEDY